MIKTAGAWAEYFYDCDGVIYKRRKRSDLLLVVPKSLVNVPRLPAIASQKEVQKLQEMEGTSPLETLSTNTT
jgi:hypothetical protein